MSCARRSLAENLNPRRHPISCHGSYTIRARTWRRMAEGRERSGRYRPRPASPNSARIPVRSSRRRGSRVACREASRRALLATSWPKRMRARLLGRSDTSSCCLSPYITRMFQGTSDHRRRGDPGSARTDEVPLYSPSALSLVSKSSRSISPLAKRSRRIVLALSETGSLLVE